MENGDFKQQVWDSAGRHGGTETVDPATGNVTLDMSLQTFRCTHTAL